MTIGDWLIGKNDYRWLTDRENERWLFHLQCPGSALMKLLTAYHQLRPVFTIINLLISYQLLRPDCVVNKLLISYHLLCTSSGLCKDDSIKYRTMCLVWKWFNWSTSYIILSTASVSMVNIQCINITQSTAGFRGQAKCLQFVF
jgi:hypothetical protein